MSDNPSLPPPVYEGEWPGTNNGTRSVYTNVTSLDANATPSQLLDSVPELDAG